MAIRINKPLFEGEREPVSLPQEILDSLLPNFLPDELSLSERPIVRNLREITESRRLGRRDIFKLLEWEKNPNKGYRYIDNLLDGSKVYESFAQRVFEALGLDAEAIQKIFADDRAFLYARSEARCQRHAHAAYRRYGPHLYPMSLLNERPSLMSIVGDFYFYIRVPFGMPNGVFTVPTAREISRCIANPPGWFEAKSRKAFGAYLYHRLPEEMIFYDMDGNILSQGDTSLPYPEGVKRFG